MSERATFWYLFGLAALFLLFLRLRPTRRADLRDPVVFSFSGGIFCCAFGTLSKQPILASLIDTFLGPNAAWVVADSFFIIGLCGITCWVDLMRDLHLAERGWVVLRSARSIVLGIVVGGMIVAANLLAPIWSTLERGGIDVGGQPILLASRLAYFAFSLWGLAYLSWRFYQLRQHMRERVNYIRLSLAWATVTLAGLAPVLQFVATIEIFFQPQYLPLIWPGLWLIISVVQLIVAALVLSIFFEPAYRFITWLDKQLLIRRLLRAQGIIAKMRPDVAGRPAQSGPTSLFVRHPDPWLATLVNEQEIARFLMGRFQEQVVAPAGGVMSAEIRRTLKEQQQRFQHALIGQESLPMSAVSGDTYTLARWYAHFDRVNRSAGQN